MKKIFFCLLGFAMMTSVSFAEIKNEYVPPTLTIQNFQNWWAAGSNLPYYVRWTTQNMSPEYDRVYVIFRSVDGKYTLAQDVKNNGKHVLNPIRRRVYDLEKRILDDGGYTLVVCAYREKDFSHVCDTRSSVEITYEY